MLKNIRYHLNHERADKNDPDRFYVVAEDETGKRVQSLFKDTKEKALESINLIQAV